MNSRGIQSRFKDSKRRRVARFRKKIGFRTAGGGSCYRRAMMISSIDEISSAIAFSLYSFIDKIGRRRFALAILDALTRLDDGGIYA